VTKLFDGISRIFRLLTTSGIDDVPLRLEVERQCAAANAYASLRRQRTLRPDGILPSNTGGQNGRKAE
jgi:hypothetical protein